MLSDRDILKLMESKDIVIYPFYEDCLAPDGYYVHIMPIVKFYRGYGELNFAGKQEDFEKKHLKKVDLSNSDYKLKIRPQESALVATFEELGVSKRVGGKFIPSMVSRVPLHISEGVLVPGWNESAPGVYTVCLTNLSPSKTICIEASYKKDNKVYWGDQIGRIRFEYPSSDVMKGYDESVYKYPRAREPQAPVSWMRFSELKKRGMPLDPKTAPEGSKLAVDVIESLDAFSEDGKRRKK
ncbi:MAG: hypothetical protein QXU82_00100 [Candidatus Aenigmatarchaeota archaeon]